MNQTQIEDVKKRVLIKKLIIDEQKACVASAQDVVNKEYQKLKHLEKDLLELLNEQVRLEQEQRNEHQE